MYNTLFELNMVIRNNLGEPVSRKSIQTNDANKLYEFYIRNSTPTPKRKKKEAKKK